MKNTNGTFTDIDELIAMVEQNRLAVAKSSTIYQKARLESKITMQREERALCEFSTAIKANFYLLSDLQEAALKAGLTLKFTTAKR